MPPKRFLLMPLLLAALGACNEADDVSHPITPAAANANETMQASALALSRNESLITLSGDVVSTTPTSFQLDYGSGVVSVEMDDWDWYQEGRALKPGDDVIVTGRVDQDLLERRKIEASTVFVKNLGTYFYASGADEEVPTTLVYVPPSDGVSDITGLVSSVEGRELTVGGPSGPVRIDLAGLPSQPQVKVGDRIYTWGAIDIEPQERTELMAKGLVVLSPDKGKKATEPQAS